MIILMRHLHQARPGSCQHNFCSIFTGGAFKTSAIFVMHRMGATLRVDARSRAAFAALSPQAAYQKEDLKKRKGYFE